MKTGMLEPENTIEDVKVRIQKSYKNPNVGTITQAVLKEGPIAFKVATLMEIINPRTREFHHYSLKIDHIDRTKNGWFHKPDKSVRLEGKEPDEINKLFKFLSVAYNNQLDKVSGELHIINASDYKKLENIIEAIPNIADIDKLYLVGNILSSLDAESSSFSDFVNILKESKAETLNNIAAASKMIEYSKAINRLKELLEDNATTETQLQKHLEINPWMFGSEYSELLPRRNWTRDDQLDYMLRKTVDDYLEIVEIKTAFKESLFLHDPSHDSYYPSSKLSPVLGQVTRYIEEVERNRDSIIAIDGSDPLKIRARIIVGRDGNQKHQKALRNFNAHLYRIEVITYDQLIKIAERVLSMFGVLQSEVEEDLPF
ncbi:MAG: DUF4263 domain-containing protein [Candidatus Delongbacteria bacterium]|nr:DUF4263 domain-containing protein [Candidatus Delongbacteria bacterium]MCG2759611.1 DUF4263 domain-containing protein [Candidatus Delongbacteria bacterium]